MIERKGERLRKLAGHKNARTVAEKLGIATNRLYQYENEGSAKLGFHDAVKLAAYYGCRLSDLIDDTDFEYTLEDTPAVKARASSVDETSLLTFYRFATPFSKFSILRDTINAVLHPGHLFRSLEDEEAALRGKYQLLAEGLYAEIPNAKEIIDELIKGLQDEREAASRRNEASDNTPIPPILRRRRGKK
ncbi:MAG: XRE family transcriptional regulator [Myxococcales bacterium]|nr:MAG: XRE family transcriptional regulator [Myxococcales bacterium]